MGRFHGFYLALGQTVDASVDSMKINYKGDANANR
jgi:hypothetical protein